MGTDTISQDQRKRALEALERRFAVAKAELLQQQKKSKKGPNEEDRKEKITENFSLASSGRVGDSPMTPSSSGVIKKGNFSFSGHSASKDLENDGLTYSQLSRPVHENLLATNDKFQSKRSSMVDKILHELLQHGDSAHKYTQRPKRMKIDNWILLDNYVAGRRKSSASLIRDPQNRSKRSKNHMSMKQHKKCGTFDLSQDLKKFDVFKPMHEMWKSYIMQLLKPTGGNQLAQWLLNADLHGAIILVAECKITYLTGISGIMIRETAETFGIITQDDKFRVVPKRSSVFIFPVDCWKITLHGDKRIPRS